MGLPHKPIVNRLVEYCPTRTVLDEYDLGDGSVVEIALGVIHHAGVHIEEIAELTTEFRERPMMDKAP